ncbi:MAG: YeeE/YedE family protein [Sulfurifustaceae bacterium]
MEWSNIHLVALLGFVVAVAFGAVAHHTHFCTMGGISDWLHIGDTSRLRAWLLAIGVAILGVEALSITTPIDFHKSIYLTTNFGWLGHVLGGFLFGVGMTLASGCGQRTLVRVGGGNLKSLVVLLVLAIVGYMTLRGLLALPRIDLIEAANVDLKEHGVADQAIPTLLAAIFGLENTSGLRAIVAALAGGGLVVFTFSSAAFRRRFDQIYAGVSIGLFVVAGWTITGVVGFDDFEPARLESYTFVGPVAENLQYLMTFTGSTISFGIASVFGVILGSFLYAIATGNFRLEGFASREDLMAHLLGGALMGFGGVCALGCTIGQGITGMSTLALGSLLTFVGIVFGAVVTMRMQYHLLDQPGFWRAAVLTARDLPRLPAGRNAKTV